METPDTIKKAFSNALFDLWDKYPQDYKHGNRGLALSWTCSWTLACILAIQKNEKRLSSTGTVFYDLVKENSFSSWPEDQERLKLALNI